MTRIVTIAGVSILEVVRKKDIYVLFILLGALLVCLVSLDVFGVGKVVRYVSDLGLLAAWLFSWVLAVNIGSRQLPQEESRGTIFSLLAKPVLRYEVLLGKWLGGSAVVVTANLMFYALIYGIVLLYGGRLAFVPLLQAYLLHSTAIMVMCAIGIMFSTRMNNDAAASLSFILTAASLVLIPRIPDLSVHASRVASNVMLFLYNALPHFEVFDLRRNVVHDYGVAAWPAFFLALAYGVFLCLLFLSIAWLTYHRKRFTREKILH